MMIACPRCGYTSDHAVGVGRRVPRIPVGAFAVCARCLGINVYEATAFGLRLRPGTASEIADIADEPLLQTALKLIAARGSKE